MLLALSLLRWWYGDGWRSRARLVAGRLEGVIDYFSVDLLIKTLFAPYRQISAGRVDGPLGVQFRAMIDKLFSRIIGAFIRLILLVVGGVTIGLTAAFGCVVLLGWSLVPLLPVVGVVLSVIGWTP